MSKFGETATKFVVDVERELKAQGIEATVFLLGYSFLRNTVDISADIHNADECNLKEWNPKFWPTCKAWTRSVEVDGELTFITLFSKYEEDEENE